MTNLPEESDFSQDVTAHCVALGLIKLDSYEDSKQSCTDVIEAINALVRRPELDGSQHATILAALRFYQERGQGKVGSTSRSIEHIATNCGRVDALDDDGINELCEYLYSVAMP